MTRPLKRSFTLKGHRTSISIEEAFWDALKAAAAAEGLSLAGLVSRIDETRGADTGLSSAVRVWVLTYFRMQQGGTRSALAPVDNRDSQDTDGP